MDPKQISFTDQEKRRYLQLIRENIKWYRPKAEDIAKKEKFPFLFKYGYDYASMLIHPMATDGENDYQQLMKNIKTIPLNSLSVLQNSMVVLLLIIQTGLNASSLQWRSFIYDYIDQCLSALQTYNQNFRFTLDKIINMGKEYQWCEPRNIS